MHLTGSHRQGIALLLVLTLVLALDLLILGVLVVATRERLIADAGQRVQLTQYGAEAELRAARQQWHAVRRGAFPAVRVDTAADGLFLLRSVAARAESGALVRTMPLRALLRAFPAGIATDGLLLLNNSRIDASTARDGECVRDSVFTLPGPGIHTSAQPPFLFASSISAQPARVMQPLPALPPVFLDSLALLAEYRGSGRLTFETVTNAQRCTALDVQRGSPTSNEVQVRVCTDYWPLIAIDGEASIAGDAQGILLVRGQLRLEPAATFRGAILLAGGSFHAARDSQVFGAIRGSSARSIMLETASLHFDLCMVWRALRNSDAMNQALPTQRAWLPVF
jgi:hypothetical protein